MDYRRIEEASINALPSHKMISYDGWIIRMAAGYTKRANSINPLFGSQLKINEKVRYCEELYLNNELPTVYKMIGIPEYSELDDILYTKGYQKVDETLVKVKKLEEIDVDMTNIKVDTSYNSLWISNYVKVIGYDKKRFTYLDSMLSRIINETYFVTYYYKNKPVAFGYGVKDGSYFGIFNIFVSRKHRGMGFGKLITESLLKIGYDSGAEYAYLQVVAENIGANKLYDKLGFELNYKYWYRKKTLEVMKDEKRNSLYY